MKATQLQAFPLRSWKKTRISTFTTSIPHCEMRELNNKEGWGKRRKGWQKMRWGDSITRLNGHEFEQTLGDSEGQRSLACYCRPRVDHSLVTEQQQQIPAHSKLSLWSTSHKSDGIPHQVFSRLNPNLKAFLVLHAYIMEFIGLIPKLACPNHLAEDRHQ